MASYCNIRATTEVTPLQNWEVGQTRVPLPRTDGPVGQAHSVAEEGS